MTNKEIDVIAKEIKKLISEHTRLNAAIAVAIACKKLKPDFDEQKFYIAAGAARNCGLD
jgi:tRNA(Ser,Leu) C12 N-acetylase TAN1